MKSPSGTILIADDDPAIGKVLGALLVQGGLAAVHASGGAQALEVLSRQPVDVLVTDLRMPDMDGMALLSEVKKRWPELPVVMITAHGSVPLAVEAMRAGAADFVMKPFDREEILYSVRKALTCARRDEESVGSDARPSAAGIVGASPALKAALDVVRKAASGMATVLVRGESGTGKELVARAVHELSPRAKGPFVRLHCAALPDNLLESELFGYEKGAFTGAAQRKPGRVELAEGGTLFLDEIGDISPLTQVKLLRLLQERELERLGGTQTIKVDVRFVAATHRPLEELVAKGQFREDLFYRLNVVPVRIPPLRERADDIPALCAHFLRTLGAANGKPDARLADDALERLAAHDWPGNIRALQNFIERLLVLSEGVTLGLADVERELANQALLAGAPAPATTGTTLDSRRRDAEKDALVQALAKAKNNRSLAARLLGISRRTLYNKLEEHGLA